MAQQNVPEVGKLIEGPAFRDAIHVAVAPVVAGYRMKPGTHVGPMYDGTQFGPSVNNIGIVDPYLSEDVMPGQRFWLFLYPNTVTSLRHAWTHPAFAFSAKAMKGEDNG